MTYLKTVILLAVFALTGCSNDGSEPTSKETETTVFDSQVHAIDKTRNIENVLQQSADERQNQLDVE